MCRICKNEYGGLNKLNIKNCNNITTIPIIEGLNELYIYNCNNITTIPIIEGLKVLNIYNCKNINNFQNDIKQFNSINKIKRWYKRVKMSKKLWLYAKLVIKEKMDPHKENNYYLQKYIKENVYKE